MNTPTHPPFPGSLHPDSLHRSTVFSRVVRVVLLSGAGILLLVWVGYALSGWSMHQEVQSDIEEQAEKFRAAYTNKGIAKVIDYVKVDEKAVWKPEWIGGLLTSEDEIYQVNHADRGTIAGLEALDSGEGWGKVYLDTPFGTVEERPLLAYRFPLDADTDMTIARALPLPFGMTPAQLVGLSLWFVLSVILIALLSGVYQP